MRKEILEEIRHALSQLMGCDEQPLVRHVDLWNRNVEFIEEEDNWERPAVFVEFGTIEWMHDRPSRGKRVSMRCTSEVLLHVVTDWHGGRCEDCLPDSVTLSREISQAVTGLCGEHFCDFVPQKEMSNHDHGELLEEILVFSYRGRDEW